ncbi:unnamed protein product [Brassica oleracea var. botrytis]
MSEEKAIGRIFSVCKFSPDREKHQEEADSISHVSIVYRLGPISGLLCFRLSRTETLHVP